MHFWEDFSFGRRRVLERLVLSRKKAQEVKKFEIKSTLQLKSSILSLGMISRRTALKSPLVQGGTNNKRRRSGDWTIKFERKYRDLEVNRSEKRNENGDEDNVLLDKVIINKGCILQTRAD